jgi:AraC family transcriptional regulator, exoenzyme S synthesis regulatory protein ExsA
LIIRHLPDSLIDPGLEIQAIHLFDYQSSRNSEKNKNILRQNAFIFLLEGSKEVYFGDQHQVINPDSFLMMSAGSCLMTDKISPQSNYHTVLFFFDQHILNRFIQTNNIVPAKKEANPLNVLKYDEYISSFVQSLLNARYIFAPLLNNFLETKLHEFLYYLISKIGSSFLCSLIATDSPRENQFKQIMEMNSFKKLSIEELAFLNNMSLSTFKRTFSDVYQTTPGKWLLKQRLQFASMLLIKEGKRPIEIYEQLGFESLSSFIQAFKGEYGTTPKQFQSLN